MNITNNLSTPYKFLLILLFLGFANMMMGQDPALLDFNTQRLKINRTAMTVLGGWAISNLASGRTTYGTENGESQIFSSNESWLGRHQFRDCWIRLL